MLTSPAWLAPHVPTLLVDAHRGHRTAMLDAFADAERQIAAAPPRAAVVVSARWRSAGPFMVDASKRHRTITDYTGFGVEVRYDCDGDPPLARALVAAGTKAGVRVSPASRGVDSGITVPMRFLVPGRSVPVVPLSVADRPFDECRAWGAAIRRTLDAWAEPVLFVAGGLLSFDPHAWQLGRDVPAQAEFDERLIEALRAGRWEALADERVALAAPGGKDARASVQVEDELRHLEILRGFLGEDVRGDVRCYEPSAGVGAALIAFDVPGAEARMPDAGDDDYADFPVEDDDFHYTEEPADDDAAPEPVGPAADADPVDGGDPPRD